MSNISALVGPGRFLSLNSQGEAVKQLQLALAALGYKLHGTGFFGTLTEIAVKDFQSLSRLEADGVVGEKTAKAIDAAKCPTAQPVIVHVGRPLWVIEALYWLGTDEIQGARDNPVILKWAKEVGGAIARDYTHDAIPWCALFQNLILVRAQFKGTGTLWALDFNSNTKWPNTRLNGPAVGAIVPMVRSGGGHVATIVGRTRNGMLACIGGNQGDTVSINSFPVDRPESFRYPLGAELPKVTGFNTLPLVNSAGVPLSEA